MRNRITIIREFGDDSVLRAVANYDDATDTWTCVATDGYGKREERRAVVGAYAELLDMMDCMLASTVHAE